MYVERRALPAFGVDLLHKDVIMLNPTATCLELSSVSSHHHRQNRHDSLTVMTHKLLFSTFYPAHTSTF
jgi:hypothetical protein